MAPPNLVVMSRYDQEYSALRSGLTVCKSNNLVNLQERNPKEFQKPEYLVIPTMSGQMKYVKSVRWFRCKKRCYIWDSDSESFYKLSGLDYGQTLSDLHSFQGFSWLEQLRRRVVYGENNIRVPVTPIFKLLFLEALNPFYIFQLFSVCLWFADNYIYYASVIVITSVLSIISEVYQMHLNQVSLRSTIQSTGTIEVVRENGHSETVPSEHLVPGDVIVVPPQGCMMQCDAVLLQGTAIVNESMLTGESVPVTKTPILNRKDVFFNEKEHGRHILFCGTQVIQTRFYGNERVTAVVIRTGFMTSKGALVRSIMYPPPVDFKFQQDTYKFILVLVGIASFGFAYTVYNKYKDGLTASQIAMDSLDLITIVVPPALPMAMTVGILYALQRLKRYDIFCISPRSINISGVLNCICFDKTGTLTEDGLDMKAVIWVEKKEDVLQMSEEVTNSSSLPKDHLLFGMAACHSITIINMKMVGDPLDLKMFESTGWILEEPGNDDTSKYDMIMPSIVRPRDAVITKVDDELEMNEAPFEIGILRQFPFSSSLQRMSVITRKLSDPHFILYCKGSPEMIMSLSRPETVPEEVHEVLLSYTQRGFRVLALGWRSLKLSYTKAQRIPREEVENDLTFLGLLILENKLKEETKPVITRLKKANIRTIMVTGDNMLTALSVARECGLVGPSDEVFFVKATKKPDDSQATIQFESSLNVQTPKSHMNRKYGAISLDIEPSTYSFAIEGKTWATIYSQDPELLKKLVVRGAIFARMNPDQKRQLVMELQSLGYYVGMCGDGANDCGALKSAHVGISLSEAEASVASPFTSKKANISCVPTLIQEGRTALVTSFGVFKYMATYSLTQFVTVMILYSIHSNLTDIQFLYIDLFLITLFAFFFGRTESFKGDLASTPPSSSLISVTPIMSILLHLVVVIGFQTFTFFYVQEQPWFVPFNTTTAEEIYGGHENYAVYSLSQFQYIILAVVFSKGPPYRQPIYTNFYFTGSVIVMTTFSVFLAVAPTKPLIDVFELIMPPESDATASFFRWQIILLAIANSIIAIILEYFLIDYVLHRSLKCRCRSEKKTKKKYLAIDQALRQDKTWPVTASLDAKTAEKDANELRLNAEELTKREKERPNGVISVTQYHSSL